jgi:hypothetical protein
VTRYWTHAVIGLVLCAVALVGVDWGLYHLVRTGSCGSSNTYISTRPCPPGTGGHILALIGGIFGGLIGVAVWETRGKHGRPPRMALGLIMWTLLFVTLAASAALAAFGPANNDNSGARTAAVVLAVIFVPLGLAPLPLVFRSGKKKAQLTHLAVSGKRCPGVVVSVEDTGMTINDNPRVKITVRAEPVGEPTFTVVKTATVSRVRIPRAGDTCVVFYDPANREGSNGITFDAVPGFPVAQPAAVPADEDDPLERIAKLGELRDKGLLTPEEFEAQKKRLRAEL